MPFRTLSSVLGRSVVDPGRTDHSRPGTTAAARVTARVAWLRDHPPTLEIPDPGPATDVGWSPTDFNRHKTEPAARVAARFLWLWDHPPTLQTLDRQPTSVGAQPTSTASGPQGRPRSRRAKRRRRPFLCLPDCRCCRIRTDPLGLGSGPVPAPKEQPCAPLAGPYRPPSVPSPPGTYLPGHLPTGGWVRWELGTPWGRPTGLRPHAGRTQMGVLGVPHTGY